MATEYSLEIERDVCVDEGRRIMKIPEPKYFDKVERYVYKLPWWKKIVFYFLPNIYATDRGIGSDYTCVFKKWRGVMYLIDNFETKNSTQPKKR